MTVLPLVACAAVVDDVAETAPEPVMKIEDLDKLAAVEEQFPGRTAEESAEIWAWAHQLVAEWYERYLVIKAEKEEDDKLIDSYDYIKKDMAGEYTRIIYSSTHKQYTYVHPDKAKPTRTLSMVKGWAESSWSKFTYEENEWGGFLIEEMKQEATGYFHVKKIDGRWWLIDPDGYPTIMRAIQGVLPYYNDNQDQLKSTIAKYGSTEKWAIAIAYELKDMVGVYTTNFESKELQEVPEGFSFGTLSIPMITGYGLELGIAWSAGSTYFDANMDYIKKNDAKSEATQVMPIFDRAFEEFADRQAKEKLTPYANNPRVVVINTDNEIPIKADTLERYLKYSSPEWLELKYPGNEKNALYHETYAVTVTWMRFMTGKEKVTVQDITSELSYLFLGFLYDRLMKVSSEAIKKYDTNHIYCGNRSLSGGEGAAGPDASNSVLDREWIVRFSAQYLDAYALNWYSRWNPSADENRRMVQWTNDLPIFITEFGCKTDEGTGRPADPGYTNNGGGFYVFTQEMRGAWYESITLDFLEWGNIVGWNLYRYNNYSTGTDQNLRSSGGIINDFGVYDPYYTASMALIHKNVYSIAKFLDERQDNWDKYFN